MTKTKPALFGGDSIKPENGLPVKELDRILGRKATANLELGTSLAENHIG